mmetsp:Transcript_21661/g.40765  ORF Transcript_21661/g.40765 Transcript_21661/m.40765 type:complete len:210 (-) Transcript_21661:1075-1704(-)
MREHPSEFEAVDGGRQPLRDRRAVREGRRDLHQAEGLHAGLQDHGQGHPAQAALALRKSLRAGRQVSGRCRRLQEGPRHGQRDSPVFGPARSAGPRLLLGEGERQQHWSGHGGQVLPEARRLQGRHRVLAHGVPLGGGLRACQEPRVHGALHLGPRGQDLPRRRQGGRPLLRDAELVGKGRSVLQHVRAVQPGAEVVPPVRRQGGRQRH